MKQLQKKIKSGTLDLKKDDPFELFISATNIRYCYYAETHKILGSTYGMCVLQVILYMCMSLIHCTFNHTSEGSLPQCSLLKNMYGFYCETHKTMNTRNIYGMSLCCKK